MLNRISRKENFKDFDSLKLTLASSEDILKWSYGEVTKAETINYRTYRAEPEGLFCEKIFGPSKNYECYCGKYKKIRYRGIVCDKCGVEVTTKDVRRERMGHIELAVPVAHVWFAYGVPNKMSIILDMPHKQLLSVIYYTRYMVTGVNENERPTKLELLNQQRNEEFNSHKSNLEAELQALETEYNENLKELKKNEKDKDALEFKKTQMEHKKNQAVAKLRREYAVAEEQLQVKFDNLQKIIESVTVGSILSEESYVDVSDKGLMFFDTKMGAEAVEELLKNIDLDAEISKLKKQIKSEKGDKKITLITRMQYLEGFRQNGTRPEWMIMKMLPVIPPELRPIIPLSGGKFATSDMNDLYRRIINRNNRLKRLIEIGAPDVILRNEKRMLQEAVDALIDNSHRPSKAMMNNKKLPYQSLADELRGKKGIFRRNLLGKRVDYSGRAVIIGDATLSLDQCGLPKSIALEIFKPFVINKLLERELAPNIRMAKDMIEAREDVVWDILQEVISGRPVLLNRAPTLHKYSIQAFYPKLVEGDAIRIHPLVCKAFNADFDGAAMSVHALLTQEAIDEVKGSVMSDLNIVSIASGKLLANPSKDMLLGYFLLTDLVDEPKNPKKFANEEDALKAYYRGNIKVDELITVKYKGEVRKTTVGRLIFNMVLPADYEFINSRVDNKAINTIIDDVRAKYEHHITVKLLDDLKTLGFRYATLLAYSFAMEDCKIDLDIKSRVEEIEKKDAQLQENYLQGLSTQDEKINLSTNMWYDFAEQLGDEAYKTLGKNNAVFESIASGANGGEIQARQILAVRGMVRDSRGNWVPLPIKGNFRDGLSALEYFVAANSGRKGIADRSLKTSSSGYLTRKLVDVAHEVIVREADCGNDSDGLEISRNDDRRLSYEDRVYGRFLAADVVTSAGEVLARKGEPVTREVARAIAKSDVQRLSTRTPIKCKTPLGVCQKCYGYDLENNKLIDIGKAVGVIAAQSIGEPGTQMTMQTFHKGGVQRTDITQGLPRIEELFEARTPKAEALMSPISGKADVKAQEDGSAIVTIVGEKEQSRYYVVSDAVKVNVANDSNVKTGEVMFIDSENAERQAPFDGHVSIEGGLLYIHGVKEAAEVINVLPGMHLLISDGDNVKAGQPLTEGSLDPKKLSKVTSLMTAQKYILDEVQKVFKEQGVSVADVHMEVILRQMGRLGMVMESGDSKYLVGALVNRFVAEKKNKILVSQGKNKALVSTKLMGIKASSLYTESFLSAMSFQEQVKVLTNAAILGKVDRLRGMKENVIIGRPIPAGESAAMNDTNSLEEIKI